MTGAVSDPRIPPAEACVLRPILDRWAAEQPDKVFARFADGTEWTYAETRRQANEVAVGLQRLGVAQGEHVLSWLPNGPDALRIWFGLNYMGAVYVPINTAYKGGLLAHVIDNSDARLIVAHGDLAPRLAEIDRGRLEKLVVLGGEAPAIGGLEALSAEALAPGASGPAPLARPIAPWDTQTIVYTSGTTGPSKGVLSSYLHLYSMSVEPYQIFTADDRYMVNLPLFHVGGTSVTYAMLAIGGSIALVEAFDTATFWQAMRETGSTLVVVLGVMCGFLMKQPPAPDDRDHPLRIALVVPLGEDAPAFAARFGVEVYTVFNMTEVSCPILSEANPTALGSCGKPRPGVECRLVDAHDREVPVGAVGELMLRTDRPWAMNHGYHKNPEATARAWRNGWFHTGDAFRRDGDGNFFFVDRMKDAIRRRGENISSFEVEAEVLAHPAVAEAAAVAVPSEVAEDEVLVVVAPAPGQAIDPAGLIDFLAPRMAHFMIPRYVRLVDALPKTPTQKVQKHLLKADGITADTWDREAAGIRIRRDKIGAGS